MHVEAIMANIKKKYGYLEKKILDKLRSLRTIK